MDQGDLVRLNRAGPSKGRTGGVELLRRKRGAETVTFADVADHLEDFLSRRPDGAPTVDALARFLAGVEDVPHAHERGEGRTIDPSTPVE